MADVEISKKDYELTVIIASDLSEFDAEKAADKIQSSIASKNGEVVRTSNWGKKKLAYHIKGNEFGFYYTFVFSLSPDAVAALTHELELAPEVLRYMVIALEKEGVTIDQLFTPEKEEQMIATSVKEKMVPESRPVARPTIKPETPVEKVESTEPISQEELDQKIEEALKADLE